jgi:hypothetical protein
MQRDPSLPEFLTWDWTAIAIAAFFIGSSLVAIVIALVIWLGNQDDGDR